MEDGKFIIEGHHEQVNTISDTLAKRLLENGMPLPSIERLQGKEAAIA
jgi:pilus assembly protein CpaF